MLPVTACHYETKLKMQRDETSHSCGNFCMKKVLIGGCERSGTTMLGSMLGAHSSVICTPESQFIIDVLKTAKYESHFIVDPRTTFDRLQSHIRFMMEWNLDLASLYGKTENGKVRYSELIERLVESYSRKQGHLSPKVWIDHTPSNIFYAWILLQLFPEAKLIHIVRDGRAVTSSRIKTGWASKSMTENARFWVRLIAHGLAAESYWKADRVMRVKYEDLVGNSVPTLKTICRFMELEYEDQMSEGGNFNPVFTAIEQHKLVGKPPSSSRILSWRNELTQRQIELFEATAGGLLFYLGYEPLVGLQSKGRTPVQRILEDARELFLGNFKRKFNRYRRRRRAAKANLQKKWQPESRRS